MITVKPSISPLAVRDFADSAARIISVSVIEPCAAHEHGLIRVTMRRPAVSVEHGSLLVMGRGVQEVEIVPRTAQGYAALVMALELRRTRELFRFFRSARRIAAMAIGFAAGVAAFVALVQFVVMILADPEYTRAAQMLLLGGFAGLAARWAIRAFKASCDNAD